MKEDFSVRMGHVTFAGKNGHIVKGSAWNTLSRLISVVRRKPWLPDRQVKKQSDKEMTQLQFLSHLLHSGLQTNARVIDVDIRSSRLRRLLEVSLLLDLQHPGRNASQCIRTSTLLPVHLLPRPGDVISIRYLPQDTSSVIVL